MKPPRNPLYLRFIRSQPCLVCGQQWGIEAAHTGPHGIGQKSPDSSVIPLCLRHHRCHTESYHALGRVNFEKVHGISVALEIIRLQHQARLNGIEPCARSAA